MEIGKKKNNLREQKKEKKSEWIMHQMELWQRA